MRYNDWFIRKGIGTSKQREIGRWPRSAKPVLPIKLNEAILGLGEARLPIF